MTVADKLAKPGPRKLLALDGGGIRGLITIEVLAEIERVLREELRRRRRVRARRLLRLRRRHEHWRGHRDVHLGRDVGRPDPRLLRRERRGHVRQGAPARAGSDTSTRTISSPRGCGRSSARSTTLGSEQLRTLLLIVMRNATTDSPWPISNNPAALYNRPEREFRNLDIPLWQLVRASTAAPTYFPPEVIDIGGGRSFVFVDGGVTMYNNPAFQLFLMATLEPYNLGWATGEEQMLLVSIGTGTNPHANEDLQPGEMNLLYNAGSIPAALMGAALNEQDLLCRVFGRRLEGDLLDREVGDLATARGPVDPKLFTYVRYNAELSKAGLALLGVPDISPADVQRLDSIEHIAELQQVGRAVAAKVKREHFAGFPV